MIHLKETSKKAASIMTMLFMLTVTGSTCLAQSYTANAAVSSDPINRIKNAGKAINVAPHVNMEAKAEAINGSINSPYEELKPAFAPHGDKLYFSRVFHPKNTAGEMDAEDIWYSQYDSVDHTWSEPIRMPGFLNNSGPNFINNVSITGDTLILGNQYMKKGKMRAGLSYTVNMNGEWTVPNPIHIKNDYNISSSANHYVSLKSGIIISAVQRVDTNGGRDLYVSFWDGESATEPINMGGIINSDLEESSPYLSCDTKTLYFASKGHNGYGGYDIFMTTRLDDSWTNWTVPQNLGPAVNGILDDEFFSITHCGRYAIFSKQVNVHNVDLFKIPMKELFGQNAPSDLAPEKSPRMTMKNL
jgi:OmpA-OmpF porin, OOP family